MDTFVDNKSFSKMQKFEVFFFKLDVISEMHFAHIKGSQIIMFF